MIHICAMRVWLVFIISLHFASSFRLKVRARNNKPVDVVDPLDLKSTNKCLTSGRCTRFVLTPGREPVVGEDQSLTLHFDSCARQGHVPLQRRQWYEPGGVAIVFRRDASLEQWITKDLGLPHSIEMIQVVKVLEGQLNGAHQYRNATRPFLGGVFGNAGYLTAEDFVHYLSKEKVSNFELFPGERVDFLFDLKIRSEAGSRAACPTVGKLGNFAYSAVDNLNLMIFARGNACKTLACDSPKDSERYCLDRNGDDLRGWLVAVDLGATKPVVRNPDSEEHRAWTGHKETWPEKVKKFDNTFRTHEQMLPLFTKGHSQFEILEAQCRFLSYSPEQWLAKAAGDLIKRSALVINTNFYLFADIQRLPCGTPLGPVVSDGHVVQSMHQTMKDMQTARWRPDFELLKAQHVLVMYKGVGAFVLRANIFDQWFSALSQAQQADINAVTGHKILKEGQPIDHSKEFRRVGQDAFWNRKYSRTVVGIQYDRRCALPSPPGHPPGEEVLCGNMLLVLQFEKQSQGRTILTFFANSSMETENRPKSVGVTIPEVQDILQYMMVDEALNFDGSGSSALWTSIGDLSEKRAQPSDILHDGKYQFRPSPTLLSFEPI